MSHYKVMVDDNFHYMDEDERYQHGVFPTAEEAIAACKRIVDDDLEPAFKAGMTATELYESYTHFGSDPFVVPTNPAEDVKFSAWDYAKERSGIIASRGNPADKTSKGLGRGYILTGEHVFEQSKTTRANAVLEALRPGEAPLGSLTSEERKWLVTAFAQLNQIYEKRSAGRPGKNAFCVFEAGNVYVQFLASWDADQLVCEAASAKSVPEIASILQAEGDNVLRSLGFNEPEISPNYSQTINIEDVEDLAYAARLGFRVLKQVYQVADFGSATFKVTLPDANRS